MLVHKIGDPFRTAALDAEKEAIASLVSEKGYPHAKVHASVKDAEVDEGSDRFRASVGLGLRYITPIGPMGLLYGHKLDREEGDSAGRFHLSIGYSF